MHRNIDETAEKEAELQTKTTQLFYLSKRSLVGLILVVAVITYVLRDCVGHALEIWSISISVVAAVRLGLAFVYERVRTLFSVRTWYRIFVFMTVVTVLHFPVLFFLVVTHADRYETLFMITLALGFSSGAMSSLFPDLKVMRFYLAIVIFSLVVSLLMAHKDMYAWIFSGLLVFYFLLKMSLLGYIAKQSDMLKKQHKQLVDVQKRLAQQQKKLRYFYDEAPIGIFSFDPSLVIIDCNKFFLEMFKLTCEEITGKSLKNLPDHTVAEYCEKALKEGLQHYIGSYRSMKGIDFWIDVKILPVYDDNGIVTGGIGIIEDKSKEHNALERLNFLASHDSLTGLKNRHGFVTYLRKIFEDKRHENHYSVLFYLDLNGFKSVNDTLGHEFGDKLLKAIAERLRKFKKENTMEFARLGGDEFVIFLGCLSTERDDAVFLSQKKANEIHRVFEHPFEIDEIDLYMRTSIGVVIIEPGNDDIDEILRFADVSMYQAKRSRSESISYYNMKWDSYRQKSFALQQKLSDALRSKRFKGYFQPIVSVKEKEIVGAEVLARWYLPDGTVVRAEEFLCEAYELGIVADIGWEILEQTCETIAEWKRKGIWRLPYVSINIDAKQMLYKGFLKRFFSLLERYDVSPSEIKLEITETTLLKNYDITEVVIGRLRKEGIECFIDDFGTGYSSLAYLHKLSFSTLKVDKTFIDEIENPKDDLLLKTIVKMARELNYRIIVEGVEREKQFERLKEIDDRLHIQGYWTGKPVSKEVFEGIYLAAKTGMF